VSLHERSLFVDRAAREPRSRQFANSIFTTIEWGGLKGVSTSAQQHA